MTEVEERIHAALARHPVERTASGYRLAHPGGVGTSSLEFRELARASEQQTAVAIAEVVADYDPAGLPSLHAAGIQRLNALAVYGAYDLHAGRLRQRAQFTLYTVESAAALATKLILDAFGAQLPLGRSVALSIVSATALEQHRAHHAMPGDWPAPLEEQELRATVAALQQRGLVAANNATVVWAELPLAGDCPSRAIDPKAQTALLEVHAGVLHPIAGAGYLAAISLPFPQRPTEPAELCRRLNAAEFELADFVPRLGAWGVQGVQDLPGYHCFLPCPRPFAGMHHALMWWCVQRAAWIRDRYWSMNDGFDFEHEAPAASA
ncbi:MAG TPA: hypothetical protein VMU86_05695 [Steroidobacteraceae bacterium]|nr:hypothetical protein [Steroidobacteraceae bacterium]